MADEEVVKVLKIRTQVEGDAVSKLQAIQQEMGKLATGGPRRAMEDATRHVTEFQRAAANLGQSVLGVGRTFKDLVTVLGPVPVAIGLIGYEIVRSIAAMKEHAKASADMANAARRAGVTSGEFKLTAESLQRVGLTAQQAAQTISGLSKTLAELDLVSSGRRQKLMQAAGPFWAQMQEGLIRMNRTGITYQQQLIIAQEQLELITRLESERTHNARMVALRRQQWAEAQGTPELVDASKRIQDYTDEQRRHADKLNADQVALNDELLKEQALRKQMYDEANAWLAPFETRIVRIGERIEKDIIKQLEELQKGHYWPGWDKFLAPPGSATPNSRVQGGTGAGGGAPWIAPFMGQRDPADVWGLAPGSLGYGDITQGWRRSANIEDFRGKTEDQTHQVDQNTDQLHELNLRLQRWLERMGAGAGGYRAMAKGGVVRGPTRALVGEAGPEAVVTRRGTSIVSQPTHTVLGADGPAAVVPLQGNDDVSGIHPNALGFIRAIGRTESDFSYKEAYSDATNRKSYGGKTSMYDYGYYQMANRDIDDAVNKLGMSPDLAQHLTGGPHHESSLAQQTVAVNEYLKRRWPEAYKNLIENDDYEGMRQATRSGKSWTWFGLRDDPKGALAEYDRTRGAFSAAYAGGFGGGYTPMAEGGIVLPDRHVPSRSLFSQQQFANYLSRTQLLSNPISDVTSAVRSGVGEFLEGRPQGASSAGEALMQALPSYSRFRQAVGAVLSPFAGAIDTTVGRGFAGLTGMERGQANQAAELAMSAITGAPGVTDLIRLPVATRTGLQGIKQAASFAPPQLEGTSINAFEEQERRRVVDRAADGGGTIDGTVTIDQKSEPAPKPKPPLFRPTHSDRRAQMTPAAGGPSSRSDEASSISYGW